MKTRMHVVTLVGALAACVGAASPSRADPPATPTTRDTVALGAAGVALAGVATAVTFGVLALQNKHDFDKNPTYAAADQGTNDAAYADGGIALAVCAGVTSLVLWLTRDTASCQPAVSAPSEPVAMGLSPSLFVTSHGGSAGALVHF